jgi:hypothetical protein
MKNALGSVPVSVTTQPVGGTSGGGMTLPSDLSLPTISGTPQDGQTLTAAPGSWAGSPTVYTYQWQRCDSTAAACAPVAGATTAPYAVQAADVGSTLRVAVTATNVAGSSVATSAATAVVTSAPPAPPPPPPPPPPAPSTQTVAFSGSLNAKTTSRSFSVTVGTGLAHAELVFSRCSALTLGLSNGSGSLGPSVVVLNATLNAGTYAYTVSGGKCSFTLKVTSPTP